MVEQHSDNSAETRTDSGTAARGVDKQTAIGEPLRLDALKTASPRDQQANRLRRTPVGRRAEDAGCGRDHDADHNRARRRAGTDDHRPLGAGQPGMLDLVRARSGGRVVVLRPAVLTADPGQREYKVVAKRSRF